MFIKLFLTIPYITEPTYRTYVRGRDLTYTTLRLKLTYYDPFNELKRHEVKVVKSHPIVNVMEEPDNTLTLRESCHGPCSRET